MADLTDEPRRLVSICLGLLLQRVEPVARVRRLLRKTVLIVHL